MKENQYFVHTTSASLAAEVLGEGDPIVFLHAAVTDRRMWRVEIETIAAYRKAIAYDRRGFGKTIAEHQDYSSVDDLMAVLDITSNGAPAVLVGCSQGGRIAIDAALAYPERISGLVLIAPNVTGEPTPKLSARISELLAVQKQTEASGDKRLINQIKSRLWLDGPLAPENRVSGSARKLFAEMHSTKLNNKDFGSDKDDRLNYHQLIQISLPTLVLWGDLDFPHIQDRCRYLVSELPNARGVEMCGVAHLPSLERPTEVAQQIVDFIGSLEAIS
ncbi:alpha/beta fold hydrolase [Halovulum sp. GXIMD14793]